MKTMSMVVAICLVGTLLAIGAYWRAERVRCAYRIRTPPGPASPTPRTRTSGCAATSRGRRTPSRSSAPRSGVGLADLVKDVPVVAVVPLAITRRSRARDDRRHHAEPTPRAAWMGVVVVTVFALLLGKLFWLQVIDGPRLRGVYEQQQKRPMPQVLVPVGLKVPLAEKPPRGPILDRTGRVLASSYYDHRLYCDPSSWETDSKHGQLEEIASELPDLLEEPKASASTPPTLAQEAPAARTWRTAARSARCCSRRT